MATPFASTFEYEMKVDNPISWKASEDGIPVLLLLSKSSPEYDLHSGPMDSILSLTTIPHEEQMASLVSESKTIEVLLHKVQASAVSDASL